MYLLRIRTLVLFVTLLCAGCSRKPTGPDEFEGLLTDEELLTPEDPDAPSENPAWVNWIQQNHYPIRSLTSHNFADLQFLKSYLAQKRIVQLGESGHGVKEFNLIKVRLIKFLHEEMGFNVIAFESSVFECFFAYRNRQAWSAEDIMRYSIYNVWHNQEVHDLFDYIKESNETSNPLILAGIDITPSAYKEPFWGAKERPGFFKEVIENIDPEYAQHIYELDSEFIIMDALPREEYQVWFQANLDGLKNEYINLLQFHDDHLDELLGIYQDEPLVPHFSRQTAWSLLRYIYGGEAYQQGNFENIRIREKGMADNLEFLLNTAYPNDKVIIWAHNGHVGHDQTEAQGGSIPWMGYWIYQRHQTELYTIALNMYRGTAAEPPGTIYQITPAISGSLESIFYRIRKKFSFVDLSRQEFSAGTSWMFEPITVKSWGLHDFSIVLRDEYSGILFIDTVSPPDYMWWIEPCKTTSDIR